ncbi:Hypothetical protein FKW44_013062 [Caligus rogercresseyi]|uniref:Uncharacterized protein n=1 Tax=Caligus rogercresseyi TaxID=217165 RepID=A0A7T8KA09_CALRO|nr:Hypothetical protein FKW44_013062 [Caligus rogercresseyi]
MPHYCAWRGLRVLWPRVWNPILHHCAWRDRTSFGRGLETPITLTVLAGPEVLWPRVRNPNTLSLCLTEPESLLDEGSLKLRNSS